MLMAVQMGLANRMLGGDDRAVDLFMIQLSQRYNREKETIRDRSRKEARASK